VGFWGLGLSALGGGGGLFFDLVWGCLFRNQGKILSGLLFS